MALGAGHYPPPGIWCLTSNFLPLAHIAIYLGFSWPHLGLGVVGRPDLKFIGPSLISLLPVDQAWTCSYPLLSWISAFWNPSQILNTIHIYSGKTYVPEVYHLNLFLSV